MEKYMERKRDLHMTFLEVEKANDSIPWSEDRIRTIVGNLEFFPVEVGLHQGSIISRYLFALTLDELSWGIQENIPWCMEDNGLWVNKEETYRNTPKISQRKFNAVGIKRLHDDLGVTPAKVCVTATM
ncbi:hypothetical protein Tco_0578159 [Tanacetum coccineum]